jgi:putative spermidine/putrescine transport system permease protein
VLGRSNTAGALALGMIVIMVILMWGYSALQSRTTRWQQ